jgi:hypothetical protein
LQAIDTDSGNYASNEFRKMEPVPAEQLGSGFSVPDPAFKTLNAEP